MKEKYFFLYLNTGGGHISSAKALVKYFENSHSETVESVLVNGFENVSKFAKFLVEDGYRFTQNKAIWYFEMLYYFNKKKFWARWNNSLINKFCCQSLEKRILEEKPSKIIVLHFFLNKPVVEIIKKHNLKIPVVTVITDPYTASPIWYQTNIQDFIVFSERVKKDMLEQRIPSHNIHVFPFFLNEKYQTKLSELEVLKTKENLKIGVKKKVVMVIGGGDGIPKGNEILDNILKNKPNYEIVVVCGKNEEFKKQAEMLKEKYSAKKFHVFGFIDFVYDLMNISDLVITKGGPSTLMEILILEKIPIINSYIWEQEKGNMEFVVDNGFGLFEPDVKKLPEIISNFLTDVKLYNSYIDRIKQNKIENGTKQIGEFIKNFSKTIN